MSDYHLPTESEIEAIKRKYTVGSRVELISMYDPYIVSLHEGSKGTIVGVDPWGDLDMKWDNGSTLKLIVGVDQFKVIEVAEE